MTMIEYMTQPGLTSQTLHYVNIAKERHPLDIAMAPWSVAAQMGDDIVAFEYGTLHGIFKAEHGTLGLISVENEEKGNGRFKEFMDWYEAIAYELGLRPAVLEIMNKSLYDHLVSKRGYHHYFAPQSAGANLVKELTI